MTVSKNCFAFTCFWRYNLQYVNNGEANMAVSEKNEILKKNRRVHLATIVSSLALGNVSAENNDAKGFSPTVKFFDAEIRNYSIDCELEEHFLNPRRSGRI
jgi:hypothetical protein